MIPTGGEVKTSLLNDLIDLLLISRAMHVWWNKQIHCSNIYFFLVLSFTTIILEKRQVVRSIIEYCNLLSIFFSR